MKAPGVLALVAALVAATGCAPDEGPCDGDDTREQIPQICDGDFGFGDHDFTADEKAALRRAADRWNAFVGASLVRVRAGRATCQIVAGELPSGRAAWYDFESGTITLDRRKFDRDLHVPTLSRRVDGADVEATAMHEIGHALGFNHASDGGIMCSASRADFNASDREQCAALGWCTE